MLRIQRSAWEDLRHHGEETYPHECCGAVLGTIGDDFVITVTAIVRCGNTRTDSPQNRYSIDPREVMEVQREALRAGVDIVGFYHSHPDHPARWSQTDLAEAYYTGCSYVITSVEHGRAKATNSFRLVGFEDERRFEDEEIVITPESSRAVSD